MSHADSLLANEDITVEQSLDSGVVEGAYIDTYRSCQAVLCVTETVRPNLSITIHCIFLSQLCCPWQGLHWNCNRISIFFTLARFRLSTCSKLSHCLDQLLCSASIPLIRHCYIFVRIEANYISTGRISKLHCVGVPNAVVSECSHILWFSLEHRLPQKAHDGNKQWQIQQPLEDESVFPGLQEPHGGVCPCERYISFHIVSVKTIKTKTTLGWTKAETSKSELCSTFLCFP